MSGGSYDYLYSSELCRHDGMVDSMATALMERGFSDASIRTTKVVALMREIESIQKELAEVWFAVEWVESGDSADHCIDDAVAKWRSEAKTVSAETIELTERQQAIESQIDKLQKDAESLRFEIARRK